MADALATCRAEIDAIDAQIIDLLVKRYAVVDRVVAHKQAQGLPAFIPARVDDVVQRVKARAVLKGLPPTLAEKLWHDIIAETIAYERKRNIA